jgi:hypothetical protein
VDGADLEGAIWQRLVDATVHREETLDGIACTQEATRSTAAQRLAELDQLQVTLQEKENERRRINTAYRKGVLSETEWEEQKQEIEAEEQAINAETEAARTRRQQAQDAEGQTRRAVAALDLLATLVQGEPPLEQQRQAFELAVNRLTVSRNEDGTPHAELVFDNPARGRVQRDTANSRGSPPHHHDGVPGRRLQGGLEVNARHGRQEKGEYDRQGTRRRTSLNGLRWRVGISSG